MSKANGKYRDLLSAASTIFGALDALEIVLFVVLGGGVLAGVLYAAVDLVVALTAAGESSWAVTITTLELTLLAWITYTLVKKRNRANAAIISGIVLALVGFYGKPLLLS